LKRRLLLLSDFITYLQFALNTEKLAGLRLHRISRKNDDEILSKCRLIKRVIIRHIITIYERAVRKFPKEIKIWTDYINFLRIKQKSGVNPVLAKALALHPRDEDLWIKAVVHEIEVNSNAHAARILLQRSLRINNHSEKLWKLYFQFELWYAMRNSARRRSIVNSGHLEDTDNSVVKSIDISDSSSGALYFKAPFVVFKYAIQAINDIEFAFSLLKLVMIAELSHVNNEFQEFVISKFSDDDRLHVHFFQLKIRSLRDISLSSCDGQESLANMHYTLEGSIERVSAVFDACVSYINENRDEILKSSGDGHELQSQSQGDVIVGIISEAVDAVHSLLGTVSAATIELGQEGAEEGEAASQTLRAQEEVPVSVLDRALVACEGVARMLAENTSGMQEDRREHRIGIDRADSPCSLHMLHSRLLVGLELWTVVAAMDPQRTIQRLNLEAASTSLFPAVMYDFSPRRVVNVIRSSGMTLGKSLKKKSTQLLAAPGVKDPKSQSHEDLTQACGSWCRLTMATLSVLLRLHSNRVIFPTAEVDGDAPADASGLWEIVLELCSAVQERVALVAMAEGEGPMLLRTVVDAVWGRPSSLEKYAASQLPVSATSLLESYRSAIVYSDGNMSTRVALCTDYIRTAVSTADGLVNKVDSDERIAVGDGGAVDVSSLGLSSVDWVMRMITERPHLFFGADTETLYSVMLALLIAHARAWFKNLHHRNRVKNVRTMTVRSAPAPRISGAVTACRSLDQLMEAVCSKATLEYPGRVEFWDTAIEFEKLMGNMRLASQLEWKRSNAVAVLKP